MENEIALKILNNLDTELKSRKTNIKHYDMSDIGNEIGIIAAKYFKNDLGWEKEDFISGIKHGISLTDGTH
jgi:hypothetical protein